MLATAIPRDFTAVSTVIYRLHQSYESALKLEWPEPKKHEITEHYETLQKVIATQTYNRAKKIVSPHNQMFSRMKEYPLSALLSENFGQLLLPKQKEFLLLLTFVIYELSNHQIKKSSLVHASNELRHLISGTHAFNRIITLTSSTKILSILTRLRSSKDINFQLQFIKSWEVYFKSFGDLPDVNRIELFSLNLVERNVSTSVQKVTTNNGLVVKKTVIEIATSEIDDEKSIVEIVSLDVPDDINLDYRTKEAALLYGNRLTLQEKKNLPWRNVALIEHEIEAFFHFIRAELESPKNSKIAAVIYLMSLTSQQLKKVLDTDVVSGKCVDYRGDYIDIDQGVWVRNSVIMPSAFTPSLEQKSLLLNHSELLGLPLPIELIEYLKHELTDTGLVSLSLNKLCCMPENSTEVINQLLNTLWKNNPRIFRRITISQIRALMFEKITHKYDSSYAALLLANTEFDIPTSLYYLYSSEYSLVASYKDVLKEFGLEALDITGSKDVFIGSKLCLDPMRFSAFTKRKMITIQESFTKTPTLLDEIILRHNEIACYTVLMFLAASGHRDRVEYGLVPFVLDEENGYILLSDKINYMDSAVRILPLSARLKKQLVGYRLSCRKTANLLKPYNEELATNIYQCSLPNECSTAFLSVISHSKLIGIGSKQITSYLRDEFALPVNFLRHYFSSFLRARGNHWFSKGFVGHVSNGEHLLAEHSCNRLEEIKLLAPDIDELLYSLGFEAVVINKQKGRRHSFKSNDTEIIYLPEQLKRSETIERRLQIAWVRKLIQPMITGLKNKDTFEATASSLIMTAISDNDSNIPKQRRLSLVNRFISKVCKSNGWVSFTDTLDYVSVHADEIDKLRNAKVIKTLINRVLITDKEMNTHLKVWLSLIVNSGLTLPLIKDNLNVIITPPYMENGVFWFDFINTKGHCERVIIDTMTLLILQNKDEISDNFNFNIKRLNSQYKPTVLNKLIRSDVLLSSCLQAIKDIDALTTYLASARGECQSGLIHAYKNSRIETTNLSTHQLIRWLSPNSIKLPALDDDIDDFKHYTNFNMHSTDTISAKSSFDLLKKIYNNLKDQTSLNGTGYKGRCTDLILHPWCEHLGLEHSTSVELLIEKSTIISHALVLLLLWLIKVSLRKGKKRKYTRISTVITYLSKIGKTLLEQARDSDFLKLEPEEIEKLYIDALDSRSIKNRTSRALIFKDFHQSIQKISNLPKIDWYAVDPNIGNKDISVNANIISMREYSKTMSLLSSDEDSSSSDRDVNQLILLFCYRAGMRSGEVCHLQITDIDTHEWIIHIRTSHYYTLKTTNSNRRVKVADLFSDEEKKLVIEQIERIKQYYPDQEKAWLFSDKSALKCLLYMDACLNRVRETLRLVTGDPNIRLHHCRHSFANYLLLSMNESVYPVCIRNEIMAWLRCDDISKKASQLRRCFIGIKEYKGNILDAVSMALGHVGPRTTLANYIHTLDIIMASENEKTLPHHVDNVKLLSISSLERTHGYKVLKKGQENNLAYQSLTCNLLPQWNNYQSIPFETNPEILNLSERKINVKRQMLIELNDIERIIRAKENNLTNTEITNELKVSYQFVENVVAGVQRLKQDTAYSGTNITSNEDVMIFDTNTQKTKIATKYIKKRSFQDLLSSLVNKIIQKDSVKELCFLWAKSYERTGLIMSLDEVSKFRKLSKTLDYNVIVDKKIHKVKKNYGYREGVFVKPVPTEKSNRNSIDHKFNHAMFLTSIWYSVKNVSFINN